MAVAGSMPGLSRTSSLRHHQVGWAYKLGPEFPHGLSSGRFCRGSHRSTEVASRPGKFFGATPTMVKGMPLT